MARDIVLVLTGGVMQGVFGAGVVTALSEANLYPRIHSIYSSSAGAHNAAYFLAQQCRFGSSIYYEDLTGKQFIHVDRFGQFLWSLIRHLVNRRVAIVPVVDMDYLINTVEQQRKKLDIRRIAGQPIDWFVHGYDVQHHEHVWFDGKQDTHITLKASSSASPYYPYSVACQGRQIIDGSVIRSARLLDCAQLFPDKKIVYVRNRQRSHMVVIRELPNLILESVLLAMEFGWRVGWQKLIGAFRFPSRKQISQYHNVLLIENTIGQRASETDAQALYQVYEHGLAAGQQALKQL